MERDAREEMLSHGQEFSHHLLERNPFIKMLAISGSLTNPDLEEHKDVDFFVVSKKGKVWDCFASCVFHGFLYARKLGKSRTYFCFNYLIDESAVKEEVKVDEKTAMEIVNLHVVYGHDVFRRLMEEKREIKDFCPAEYGRLMGTITPETLKPNGASGIFSTLSTPLFIPLAKLFELKRKLSHKSDKIYSDTKVIRSHYY